MLVAMIMPWPYPARVPTHWICTRPLCVLTTQRRPAFQLQACLPLIGNQQFRGWDPTVGNDLRGFAY